MFTLIDIVQPTTVEEAYTILTKRRNNQLIGGSAFLRMGKKRIGTAIELSNLGLDYIKENENEFEIGAMTTFRQLETSKELNEYFGNVLSKSVENIIGVQFRNVVTVGATVFSKYSFSDLITGLLCLDTDVELFKGGRMSLQEFLDRDYEKDLLVKIYIKKTSIKATYKDMRNSKSDYAIVNVSVSVDENNSWKLIVGARPRGARVAEEASKFLSTVEANEENINKACEMAVNELAFGTNMRGSEEYRKAVSKVLLKRGIMEVL